MSTIAETVESIVGAKTADDRVARIRLIPQHHGLGEHSEIYAAVAREVYVPHLAPDFAYIHNAPFYDLPYFEEVYAVAASETGDFERVDVQHLAQVLADDPRTLLIFRTVLGLTRDEFAHSTTLAGEALDIAGVSSSKVDGMERNGTAVSEAQAHVIAQTIVQIMAGTLFGDPPGDVKSKQEKPDTAERWTTVERMARERVPYSYMLHQRHYGGAFRQVLDATSTRRGDLIEDAVEALFQEHGIPYVRTGSHHQGDIEARFGVRVTPAPDFVVFDETEALRAILECKGANDGGTARDKALRFKTLHDEAVRLGGIPLLAVLGGIGWRRANDTLGPVVRDTDGRVFTLANLPDMLRVAPFPALTGMVEDVDYVSDERGISEV